MLERLQKLWNDGMITEAALDAAVAKGWISAADKSEIMGS